MSKLSKPITDKTFPALFSTPLVHLFILCRCYFRHLLCAAGRGACLVPRFGPLPGLLPDSPFVRATEEPLSGPLGKMDEYEPNGWQRLSPANTSPTPEVRLRSVYGYVSVSLSILVICHVHTHAIVWPHRTLGGLWQCRMSPRVCVQPGRCF